MSPTIWDTLANTPWWIYPLYYYLLRTGYLATKSRFVPLRTLRLFTLFFVLSTFALLLGSQQLSVTKFGLWLASLAGGALIGWLQFRLMRIKSKPQEALIRVPGNWLIICGAIAMIIIQLFKGYDYYLHLAQQVAPIFLSWLPVVYGVLGGIFMGKLIYANRCMKVGPYITS